MLVSEWCTPCRDAEEVWRATAQKKAIAFEVLDVGQPEGREVVARLGVRTVPSTVIDGVLRHLGVPTLTEAAAFVATAPDKSIGASQYVGLTLEATSAWAIFSSALYLAAAGAALVFDGGIAGDPPWRAVALHAFGLGFATFLIFGLGEHLLPRFIGAPIRAGVAAWLQQALGHAGTLLLVAGFFVELRWLIFLGGALALAALAIFAARLAPVLMARSD